ncbi:HutP family protein [uncultured Ilyobacter sp.]|jgi:hut operon positive regulator|uniref:HutP family protein n=1 Tax=uncultured Ilyobacter sp. TaxID=544433 RepID=UPI0029C0EF96|nr:HutP family protein [uncultured Ilyobacter sp.]
MGDQFSTFFSHINDSVGYSALLLAMTRTLEDENKLKEFYKKNNLNFVVTEIGGKSTGDFQDKINRAVIGASLNGGLIKKTSNEIHALLHASEEAKRGILVNTASTTNLIVKIAIVKNNHWIAVAIFGESSIHSSVSHERCGLGVMHI